MKNNRKAEIKRKTNETDIEVRLFLDGEGTYDIDTNCPFLDHMLVLFAKHGRFDLTIKCTGDIRIDYHHSVEDVGIVLGRAFAQALGDRAGIRRYGSLMLPMDESLVSAAVDLGGRSYLGFDLPLPATKVGDFDTELVEEFFLAFARESGSTIHLLKNAGRNTHHIIEAVFKAFARSLSFACEVDPRLHGDIPSTKGILV